MKQGKQGEFQTKKVPAMENLLNIFKNFNFLEGYEASAESILNFYLFQVDFSKDAKVESGWDDEEVAEDDDDFW